jgi:ligand-binding sensor protein/anti-sigma regulatory factor (Ser/Thr protein kinase)
MGAEGHELASLIDLDRVQRLCDSLSAAYGVTLAVLDLSGTVLVATGWQDICTHYHREHPETLHGCLESDLSINRRLVQGMDQSEHYAYRCRNGLWDVAFPLVVAGEHLANVYTGQFFFEDDDVDREAFAERARRLGFDETAYLAALDQVPVLTYEQLRKRLAFISDLVSMLGELGLSALEQERRRAQSEASEGRYRRLFDNATEGLIVFRVEQDGDGPGDLVVADLNPIQAQRTRTERRQLIGRRLSDCDGSDGRLRAYFDVVAGAVAADQPSRCEVYLREQAIYELLSVYPVADDTWVLSATDVTELREAERALRRQEEHIRHAYVDVIDAATGGKLILVTDEQLADELGKPLGHQTVFGAPSELATARRRLLRAAETRFPGRIRHTDLLSTVGEALDNALKHAGGGAYQAFVRDECLQIAVSDDGPGIDFRMLPRATLVPGFSTAASLGMGFTIMLQLCERVLLTTRPGHTVVVLEFAPTREPQLEGAGGGVAGAGAQEAHGPG